jgi:hypothetical protein
VIGGVGVHLPAVALPALALIGGLTGTVIVIVTMICVVLLRSFDCVSLLRLFDSKGVEPPDGSRDDWETFERQFAEYVAARGRRRRRLPARRS